MAYPLNLVDPLSLPLHWWRRYWPAFRNLRKREAAAMDSQSASQPMAGMGRNSQAAVITAMMNTSRRHRTIVTSCSRPKSRVFAAAADIPGTIVSTLR
jgi:hypothetical protein